MRLHAHAVAENGAAGVRTRRIDAKDADQLTRLPEFRDQPIDERALARAWRSGDADEIRAAAVRINLPDELRGVRRLVLDQ